MILALAGRRIDPPNTPRPAFPRTNIREVQNRLHRLFLEQGVGVLVCSAACGADLVALEVAEKLGLHCRIVLPFEPSLFREAFVIDRRFEPDRPVVWGGLASAECGTELTSLTTGRSA
jgi:hypothetical protein